jgi:hypothetical protein
MTDATILYLRPRLRPQWCRPWHQGLAQPGSAVAPLLGELWQRRHVLNAPDWVFVLGLVIDRNATNRDRWRLGHIADKLQEARR